METVTTEEEKEIYVVLIDRKKSDLVVIMKIGIDNRVRVINRHLVW